MIHAVPFEATDILYVGDRCDNDIRPTHEIGMQTALRARASRTLGRYPVEQSRSNGVADLPGGWCA